MSGAIAVTVLAPLEVIRLNLLSNPEISLRAAFSSLKGARFRGNTADVISGSARIGIIMPAFMGPALMSKAYFEHVELRDVEGLFAGVNRLRLIRPVTAGASVYQRWSVVDVSPRARGIAVVYHVEWYVTDHAEPVIVAEYLLRYW